MTTGSATSAVFSPKVTIKNAGKKVTTTPQETRANTFVPAMYQVKGNVAACRNRPTKLRRGGDNLREGKNIKRIKVARSRAIPKTRNGVRHPAKSPSTAARDTPSTMLML